MVSLGVLALLENGESGMLLRPFFVSQSLHLPRFEPKMGVKSAKIREKIGQIGPISVYFRYICGEKSNIFAMKRLFLSLLISVCTLCMAQTNHMKFKGIPMEGTVESFVKKLEAKGCKYIDLTNGEAVLKGDFSAFRDCYIFVMSAPHKNEVHTVGVNMPERETWEAVSIDYFGLKTLLTQKYGTPECTEEFEGEEPPTDFSKLFALLHDECKYVSTYT